MRIVIIILALLLASITARSFDLVSSRGPGAGRAILLSQSTGLDLASVPTGGIGIGEYRFDVGYNRRFELSDLDQMYMAGAYRWKQVTFALGGSQFGKSELYAEKIFKGTVAWNYQRYVFGLTGSVEKIEFGAGYAGLDAATIGVGGAVRFQKLFLALALDNLTRPSLEDGGDKTEITCNLHGELIGKGSISTQVNGRFVKGADPRLSLGQRIPLSPTAGLHWGISTEPLEYGGGFDIGVRSISLSYLVSIHPALGLTHTVGFSVGPRPVRRTTGGEFE